MEQIEQIDTQCFLDQTDLHLERESISVDRESIRRLIKDCVVAPAKARFDLGERNQMVACSNRKALGPNDLSLREWNNLCDRINLNFEFELKEVVREVYGMAYDISSKFHEASIPVYSTTVISIVGPGLSVDSGRRLKQALGILSFE